MTRRLPSALLLTALAAASVPAGAQEPVSVSAQRVSAERGWVGISVEVLATQDQAGTQRTTVTVTGVREDSPAARAGIRAGDILVSVNGAHSFPTDLRVGDTVHVTVQRAGRLRDVVLAAAPRPSDVPTVPTWTVSVRPDSMVDRMYRAMDSIRIRMAQSRGGDESRVTLLNVRGRTGARPDLAWQPFALEEVRPPFGFYIFHGEAHDSLTEAMNELNGRIRDLRSRRAQRIRQLGADGRARRNEVDENDPELRRLNTMMIDADQRADQLREAMAQAARREMAQADRVFLGRLGEPDDPSAAPAGFRPLDPYLLGQNRAAGAEVVDLRPELAEYFGVDGGVLVVDVAERTPAAQAGIQPGDVLTEVGSTGIHSISDLRAGLAGTEAEISLTVVRKGRRLQLLLTR